MARRCWSTWARLRPSRRSSSPTRRDIGTATNYDQSSYTALQKASVEIIKNTKNIAQFLDRDTRPDFAYPICQNAMNSFLNDPKSGASICTKLETQAKPESSRS